MSGVRIKVGRGTVTMKKLLLVCSFFFCSAVLPSVVFADSSWMTTSGGTFDWNNSAHWSGDFPPGVTDTVRITNDLGSAQVITNMGGASAIGSTNRINLLVVSNGLGSASVTVQQTPGVFMVLSNGFQLGQNSTLIIDTNAVFGSSGNVN